MFFRKHQKVVAFLLVFTMVFSFVMLPPRKAVAQGGLAGCLISVVAGLIGAIAGTEVPVKDYGQNLKDQCMDALFFVLNEIVLKKITADTVNWINSGFDGNPAFVEDPEKLLMDVADREFSAFLEGSELSFLCSPFELEIKKALIRQNRRGAEDPFKKKITCSLEEVSNNVENFLAGDFTDGGWDAWRALSSNNPYSNYMEVSLEIKGRQLGKVEKQKEEVQFGQGFLSYKEADDACVAEVRENIANWEAQNPNPNETEEEKAARKAEEEEDIKKMCPEKIVTPGSVINDQLNNVLPSGLRKVEAADEINEIVDALLAHYINEVFTKGLKNLSKKDSSGKSYNDKVKDSATSTPSGGGSN